MVIYNFPANNSHNVSATECGPIKLLYNFMSKFVYKINLLVDPKYKQRKKVQDNGSWKERVLRAALIKRGSAVQIFK